MWLLYDFINVWFCGDNSSFTADIGEFLFSFPMLSLVKDLLVHLPFRELIFAFDIYQH